jgi:hypothetical protein
VWLSIVTQAMLGAHGSQGLQGGPSSCPSWLAVEGTAGERDLQGPRPYDVCICHQQAWNFFPTFCRHE